MAERSTGSDLIHSSPKDRSSIELPGIIRQSGFGYIERLEEQFPDTVVRTSLQELVAALIYRTLLAGPEDSARILLQYKNSNPSKVLELGLMPTWKRPRRGRPKPRQLYLRSER